MDFLFQFQVKADDVYYKEPLDFDLNGVTLTLYLDGEINWISKGKKAHFTVAAEDKNKAYVLIWNKMRQFNNRLIFLTGESILITYLEFIIFDQAREEIRDIFFRNIEFTGLHELDYYRIDLHRDFFGLILPDVHKLTISYFNQAILADSDYEKFKALFLALEQLTGSELVEAKCDSQNCDGILICPKCNKTKKYPRTTTKSLQEFIDKTNYSKKFAARNLDAKELAKIRAKLSHPVSTGKNKYALAINDLHEINSSLSLLIRWYLEEQYGIWPGDSVVEYGVEASIEKRFKTEYPLEKFALDIPPLEDFKNNRRNTRWII
jgi:hypothetical protein